MKDPTSFVRITSAFFLALSVLCVLRDPLFLVISWLMMKMSPQFQDMMDSFGPTYSWMMTHMYIYYFAHFLVSLGGLAASLGALYKKPWSLALFPKILITLILFHSVFIVFSVYLVLSMPADMSMGGFHFPRGMMFFSQGMGILFYLGLIAAYSWLWVSFRKKEVQSLFS